MDLLQKIMGQNEKSHFQNRHLQKMQQIANILQTRFWKNDI